MQQRITPLKADRQEPVIADLLSSWDTYLQHEDRSAGTIKKYLQAVTLFMEWYEDEERAPLVLSQLTAIDLIGYRNELQHELQKATSTINVRISALRAWCAWLVEHDYLTHDPAARVKLISGGPSSKRDGLTSTQANALLRAAQGSRDRERNYGMLQILLQTGIRLSECSSLTYGDITYGERSGMVRVRAGKGNKARSVPLNASAREALAQYVAPMLQVEQATSKAIAAAWPKPQTPGVFEPLWRSQKGGALTTSAMGQMIAELVRDAGDKVPEETSAHQLRHTFARKYLAQFPGDIVGLAELLGHSSLNTTRLYGAPSTAQLAARVERLDINAYE